MAASTGGRGAIQGINITPLVDIFLVLLILVMVSSTLARPEAIEVQVPRSANAGATAPSASGLVLDRAGREFLDGVPVDSALLVERLRSRVAADSAHQVLVSADGRLPYERVAATLDRVKASGARKYALRMRKDGP